LDRIANPSLFTSIKDRESLIVDALSRDLGKPVFESHIGDIGWLENEIVFMTRNLKKWVKDEKAEDINFSFKFVSPKIRKEPLGCVLVIGCVHILVSSAAVENSCCGWDVQLR